MADKNISPEKKLLNIIEGEGKEAPRSKVSGVGRGKKFFSVAALRGRISFFKSRVFQGAKAPGFSFSLRGFNVLLQICIVGLVIYLGLSIKVEFSKLFKYDLKDHEANAPLLVSEVKAMASLLQSETYYLNKVKARNLFGFAGKSEEEKTAFREKPIVQVTKLEQMVKSFKLVGISWSKDPDAIIEDEKAKKTYFVKTGDKINKISIEAIYRDRVILHYLTEEVELR